MKKTVLAAGGFIALAVLCYVGQLSGQQQPAATTAAATPRTRIALLNITYVIKNYVKYQHFQQEIKSVVEPFQKKDADLRQEAENLRKEAEAGTTREDRPSAKSWSAERRTFSAGWRTTKPKPRWYSASAATTK